MPDMADLAGAVVFVVRETVGVSDGLGAKCEHR